MEYYESVLETVGNTPLIKLNKSVSEIPATVLAKVETFNPGHSIKDRMAIQMIDDAEKAGLLKPGGTIIECTSGNTGMGLALVAAVRGYRCIFTTTDKQSKEKIDMLKAMGAEVYICPTDVAAEDPRSYYSVASRLSEEIPNSFWCNQYDIWSSVSVQAVPFQERGATSKSKTPTSSSGALIPMVLCLKNITRRVNTIRRKSTPI